MTHLYFNLAYKELKREFLIPLNWKLSPWILFEAHWKLVRDLFCGAMLLVATQNVVLTKTSRKPLCLATKLWTSVALVVLIDTTNLVTDGILFGHKSRPVAPVYLLYKTSHCAFLVSSECITLPSAPVFSAPKYPHFVNAEISILNKNSTCWEQQLSCPL